MRMDAEASKVLICLKPSTQDARTCLRTSARTAALRCCAWGTETSTHTFARTSGEACTPSVMFSLSSAQKAARIPASPSEVNAWEQSRQERSERIQAARRAERKHTARFPPGYGPAGRVPAYVEAHVLSLEASPLARPVFSCGRGLPPCSRRPKSAPSTPDQTCAGAVIAKRGGVSKRPATAFTATESHPIANSSAVSRRPATAGGSCTTKQPRQRRKRRGSASSPLLLVRSAEINREGKPTNTDGRVRPATAPCSGPTTTVEAPSRRQGGRARPDSGKAGVGQAEARLVEKLARLSGVQPGGEFPTVAALKTVVAIKALQVQLHECRAHHLPHGTLKVAHDDRHDRAASQTASSTSQEVEAEMADVTPSATSRARCASARMRRRRHEKSHRQRELEPWDNRAPHSGCEELPGRNSANAPGSPTTSTAASLLRALTNQDPVFGCLKVSSPPSCPRRHPGPHSATPSKEIDGRQATEGLSFGASPAAGAGATTVVAVAIAPQEMQMQACFRRLTVGTLIELNRLHNPPKPVQAVLEILACLLGWRKLTTLYPNDQKGRDCRTCCRLGEHRSQTRPRYPPRTLFSNAYALRDVLASISPQRISDRRLSALTRRLGAEEAAPTKVRSANVAAAILLEWILAVVTCARVADDAAS